MRFELWLGMLNTYHCCNTSTKIFANRAYILEQIELLAIRSYSAGKRSTKSAKMGSTHGIISVVSIAANALFIFPCVLQCAFNFDFTNAVFDINWRVDNIVVAIKMLDKFCDPAFVFEFF